MNDLTTILDDIFFKDCFFENSVYSPIPNIKKVSYPVDMYEDENESLVIQIASIGLNKEDITIEALDDNSVLTVNHESESDDRKYIYKGITNKSFDFAWKINDKFDLTKINAELDLGLLKITIPVSEKKKPKQINIKIK